MDNKYMFAKSKTSDVKFIMNEPQQDKPSLLSVALKALNKGLGASYSFTLSFVRFVGNAVDVTINALSRLVNIRIGLFDAQKVELCEEITRLKGELSEKKLQNKRLDAENYLLYNALSELESGGNMCYDKVVQWFGKDSEPALRWRSALLKSNSSRGFIYEEASEYHEARMNQQWVQEYDAKKKDVEHKVRTSSKRKRKR